MDRHTHVHTYIRSGYGDRHTHVRMYIRSGYGDRHTHVRTYIRSGFGDRHTLCRHIAWYIAHTHKQTLSCFNWEHVCTRRFLICAIQATEYVLSRTTDTYHSCATKCHTDHTTSHPIPSQYLWSTVELQLLHDTYTYLHTLTLHTGKQRLAQLVQPLHTIKR